MLSHDQIIEVAQELLSERFGGDQRLTEVSGLEGSGSAVVLRARAAASPLLQQRAIVIKYVPATGDRIDDAALIREVVSYQFTTALPEDVRPGPVLLAYDIDRRILVITDSGNGDTYAELLARAGTEERLPLLRNLGRAIGRMHAGTADRESGFTILLHRMLRNHPETAEFQDARDRGLPGAIARGIDLVAASGVEIPDAVRHCAADAQRRLVSGHHRAFTPFDLSPDNIILVERTQFLDYEWAGFRDATFDVACVIAGFPQFLFTRAITDAEMDAFIASWVEEVRDIWPKMADNQRLHSRILTAMVGWALSSVCYLYYGSMNQVISEYGEAHSTTADQTPAPEVEAVVSAAASGIDSDYGVLADALSELAENRLAAEDLEETFTAMEHYAQRGTGTECAPIAGFARAVLDRLGELRGPDHAS